MSRCLAPLLGIAALLASAGTAWSEPPQELRKLHALLVIDTLSGLGESVVIDGERVKHLLQGSVPRDRLELTVLKDKDVTAAKILNYYKDRKIGPTDAALFYYAGHGATDPKKGHFLALQELDTAPLLREDLRKAMLQGRPGLAILVTDCCSNRVKFPDPPKRNFRAVEPRDVDPVLKHLLFQHRGLVDLTASTDNFAYGDDHDGGLFTRTLVGYMRKSVAVLDGDRDGFVAWAEVFPRVQSETEKMFDGWAKEARGRGEKLDQKSQKPRAFALCEPSVTLLNPTKKAVRYQYRWEGESAWSSGVLPADGSQSHAVPPERAAKQPRLEVKFDTGETGLLRPGKSYKFADDGK